LDPLNNRLNRNTELIQNLIHLIKEPLRILAVDDMPYNINCIKMIFKKITNIEIIPAFNGQDAVEIIQNDQND
jgi:PleD family two-component response regulator